MTVFQAAYIYRWGLTSNRLITFKTVALLESLRLCRSLVKAVGWVVNGSILYVECIIYQLCALQLGSERVEFVRGVYPILIVCASTG